MAVHWHQNAISWTRVDGIQVTMRLLPTDRDQYGGGAVSLDSPQGWIVQIPRSYLTNGGSKHYDTVMFTTKNLPRPKDILRLVDQRYPLPSYMELPSSWDKWLGTDAEQIAREIYEPYTIPEKKKK